MKLKADPQVERAIAALSTARDAFEIAVDAKLILGNDNHIGDIGEYWVREYYQAKGLFKRFAPAKNSNYDLELVDSTRVSVKTITEWSKNGYGTQVKPLCGANWQLLAAVHLDRSLHPSKIAIVSLQALLSKDIFVDNERRREKKGTKTFPRFQWWPWLDEYVVYAHA
jgi:hypothetical protein